ncbi:MANSC domain-containing protein 4 [Aplochiton taeniatus]
MHAQWSLITMVSLVYHVESKCSATSYYKNCWIRRFPGTFIDIGESQRRGAQLLKFYQEETALKCSRTCCLTRNFSCNLAIFHYDTTRENVNCYHMNCPKLDSCIFSHRSNVILYNITKGVDPDLLVFGKHFMSNVRAQPNLFSRVNISEPLASDKRHFNRPPLPQVATLTLMQITKNPSKGKSLPPATTQGSSKPSKQAPSSHTASTTAEYLAGKTQASSKANLENKTTKTSLPIITTTLAPFILIATSLSLHTSPPISLISMARPANMGSSKQNPNDTKGYLVRNHTADQEISSEGTTGWDVAIHTLVVAVATCTTVLLSCCCSFLLVARWRGRKKRKGCYKTAWRGKRGSMQLIKYVIVRESN